MIRGTSLPISKDDTSVVNVASDGPHERDDAKEEKHPYLQPENYQFWIEAYKVAYAEAYNIHPTRRELIAADSADRAVEQYVMRKR